MVDSRPNPDELLKHVERQENLRRGRLRIFFGMCPGVGKTYSMLKAAIQKQKQGARVLVGIVETHKRSETEALLQDLHCLPRKIFEYKGTLIEEMDIDALLDAHPDLAVVDELAHTNVPESRHPKRYQDVAELLNAGIDVYTTVNVQHVESRADVVQQIAGIRVRETIPDTILDLADQIELIDISPQELLRRLKEGKVYFGEGAERAAQNFFKEEHITALRELALRYTAEKVDEDLRSVMTLKNIEGPWNTNERLLVAISHSPHSERLIRATKRLAFKWGAPWIVLYVETGERISRRDQDMLLKNLALAKELRAEVMTTRDSKIDEAVLRICAERNVTQVVLGRPGPKLFGFFGSNLFEKLMRADSFLNLHVLKEDLTSHVHGEPAERHMKRDRVNLGLFKFEADPITYWWTLWFMAFVGSLSYGVLAPIGYKAVGFVFLLAVILVSFVASSGPTLFAAFLSAVGWNYFFIPPRFTLSISSFDDSMMCLTFFIVAMSTGVLTSRIRKQRADLLQREHRANMLYQLGRDFAEARELKELAEIATKCVAKLFEGDALVIVKDETGKLNPTPLNFSLKALNENDLAVANWTFSRGLRAGWNTDTLASARCLCIPLHGRSGILGVFIYFPAKSRRLTIEHEDLIDTIVNHLAAAIEREFLQSETKNSRLLEESEKLHQALLNSVSHELRTPLTSLIGTATALQDPATLKNENVRKELIDELIDSAERLNRVVENLLDTTRLSTKTSLKKEIFGLQEFIETTLRHLARPLRHHQVSYHRRPRDYYVEGDPRLLEHALSNVLLNAAYYSPAHSQITISVEAKDNAVSLKVVDEGQGIPSEHLRNIFKKFFRVPGTSAGGIGLGLSNVKAIVEIHGGSVGVINRADRSGIEFSMNLRETRLPDGIIENRQ